MCPGDYDGAANACEELAVLEELGGGSTRRLIPNYLSWHVGKSRLSLLESWLPLRRAFAAAREMCLFASRSQKWGKFGAVPAKAA